MHSAVCFPGMCVLRYCLTQRVRAGCSEVAQLQNELDVLRARDEEHARTEGEVVRLRKRMDEAKEIKSMNKVWHSARLCPV
jgi:hypothetical protein